MGGKDSDGMRVMTQLKYKNAGAEDIWNVITWLLVGQFLGRIVAMSNVPYHQRIDL